MQSGASARQPSTRPPDGPFAISIAIVTFDTEPRLVEACLASLATACAKAREEGLLGSADLFIVENGAGDLQPLRALLARWNNSFDHAEILHGHGNLGYGKANNLVLPMLRTEMHIVMNPDVMVAPDALAAALRSMAVHGDVGLLAPAASDERGVAQYLCKRYPSLWILFLRGFAPGVLRKRFASQLAAYEMHDAIGEHFVAGIPLASGAFMLMRTDLFRRIGGFDPGFFMYFEDYDLSLRLAREAKVAYEPSVRIVHQGGEAARKGWRHVAWFTRSAGRFFSRHGWKLV
jgi:GT2 family glycosyltransferase